MRRCSAIGTVGLLGLALGGCPETGPLATTGSASEGIVFVANVGENAELMRARLSDGALRAVTETPEREERWPYWSESGRRLVFQVRPLPAPRGSRGYDLVLLEPGGEERRFETPERDERWPGWSPDGRTLVYAFWDRGGGAGVELLDIESATSRTLASSEGSDFFFRPNFAPDFAGGRGRLVAQRRGSNGNGSNLWILAPDEEPRALTKNPAWFDQKAWFDAGASQVVYSRRRVGNKTRDLARLPAGGGKPEPLTRNPESDDHSARPSPRGVEIAFVSEAEGNADIVLLDPESGELRKLTNTPELDELAPRWSPDGERLVVTVAPSASTTEKEASDEPADRHPEAGSLRVRVLDREGRVLLDVPGMMPDWMPAWP